MSSSSTSLIEIVVNGDPQRVESGLSVLDLLHRLKIQPERVAVELDRSIVRQAQWPHTPVNSGARVEIVQFVGGG